MTWRYLTLAAAAAVLIGYFLNLDPISQNPFYHNFVDDRTLVGVPNAWNVLTNLPYLFVGLWGLCVISLSKKNNGSYMFVEPWEHYPYVILFLSIASLAITSSYYHFNPVNETLIWDRLSIGIIGSSIFGILLYERVSTKGGLYYTLLLILLGIWSVFYWGHTESLGRGDLRYYALTQLLPMVLIPFLITLFKPRYTHGAYFVIMLALYFTSKMSESYDGEIYTFLGETVSGHSLKHLISALALICLPLYLKQRKIVLESLKRK